MPGVLPGLPFVIKPSARSRESCFTRFILEKESLGHREVSARPRPRHNGDRAGSEPPAPLRHTTPNTGEDTLPMGTVLLPNILFFSIFVHFINHFQIGKHGNIF